MADQSEIRRDRDCLRVVIDDGSGYLKVEAQHVRAGESARGVPTDTIQLQEGMYSLATLCSSIRSL